MITIFHKPHRARKSEASFVQALQHQFPQARYCAENYPIETRQVSRIVTAAMSIMWLGTLCGIGIIFYQRLTMMLSM